MVVPEELRREMGCTRAEFLRWLPGATRHAPMRVEGDVFHVAAGAGGVRIEIEERPPRRIASIVLPVLAVRFCFEGMDGDARGRFVEWFDSYTRRGGG
jgi:hypothetical protein